MLTLTFLLLAFACAAGILAGGYVARTEASIEETVDGALARAGFAVRAIHLAGNERTTEEAAFSALGIERGRSIFAIDPDGARSRLLGLPWVAEAEVRRQFPDTVAVRLIEKRPFALWRMGGVLAVVERSGAVIVKEGAAAFRLPLLIGNGAPEAAAPLIDALAAYKTIGSRLRAMQRVGARRWDLLLDGGVTANLPEQGWEAELAELERLIAERRILERDIEIIDLRYPDNYIFRLHNGDSRVAPRQQRA